MSGFDPSGRAGLVADLSAISSLRAVAVSMATALTAQGVGTFAVDAVSAKTLSLQLRGLLELGRIDGVKVGMIPSRAVLQSLWRELCELGKRTPLVVDPVVRTSLGQRLSSLHRRDYLALAAPNVVLTPNLAEASWLLDRAQAAQTVDDAAALGGELVALGFGAVVVKGGHLRGRKIDVVCDAEGVTRLEGAAIARLGDHRGTGCRFASALAVGLARGASPVASARGAKRVVEKFLRAPLPGGSLSGRGPAAARRMKAP